MPAVLLLNLGTPAAPEAAAVRAFLREFLGDPRVVDYPGWLWRPLLWGLILRRRPRRLVPLYRRIWRPEGAPLRVDTERMAAGLARELGGRWTVAAAYRYGRPGIGEVLAHHRRAARVVAVPLFPHPTAATTGTITAALAREAAAAGLAPRLRTFLIPPTAPFYVEALVAAYRAATGGTEPDAVLLSFHGVPRRVDRREGGAYRRACAATAAAFRERAALPPQKVHLAFQSRFGPEPWLGPATARVLRRLPRRGVRRLAVLTPGFLTEGLETLDEIAHLGRAGFLAAGGQGFTYVPTVGTRPEFLSGLARELRRFAAAAPSPSRK